MSVEIAEDRRVRGEFQYDERGGLVRARVPMMFRDAAMRDADRREVQRQIREFQGQTADRQVVDGTGDGSLGLHRPGVRLMSDANSYDAVAIAYQETVANTERAWIDGPAHVAPDVAPDTASAPAWRDGLSMSASDAHTIKDQAYDAMIRESEQAWKTLGRQS